jgi:hypothetical protein
MDCRPLSGKALSSFRFEANGEHPLLLTNASFCTMRPWAELPANCAVCLIVVRTGGSAMHRLRASMTHPLQRMTRMRIEALQGVEIALFRFEAARIGTVRA